MPFQPRGDKLVYRGACFDQMRGGGRRRARFGMLVATGSSVDLVHRFACPIRDGEGRAYVAEAHGRSSAGGLWEGWIEFLGVGRGIVLRTSTETRQPTRRGLVYWASGLQPTYLEGALLRAMRARLDAFRDEVA